MQPKNLNSKKEKKHNFNPQETKGKSPKKCFNKENLHPLETKPTENYQMIKENYLSQILF